MKKSIKAKLRREKPEQASARITNDTVAEHRERVIAGGRRYKYPLQYAKHKIVINTAIISVVAVTLLLIFGWWQLYVVQNSSTFFYRVTQVLPLPVGNVDGESARFSDYLLNYRASEFYLSKYDDLGANTEGGKLQLQYKKQDALNIALADAYARKVAKEKGLTVTDDEVREVLDGLRNASNGQLSEQTSEASSQRILGMTSDDLRTSISNSILRSKAAFAVDEQAKQTINQASELLAANPDFKAIAEQLNATRERSAMAGSSGAINVTSTFAGLRASGLTGLEVGALSGPLQTATDDGYYIVKLISKTDTQVSFDYIHVPLTQFAVNVQKLKDDGKVDTYITIKIDSPTTGQSAQQ